MSRFTKEISCFPVFNCQQTLVVSNMFISGVSAFYTIESNMSFSGDSGGKKASWHDIELANFDQLVASRKEYLDTLPSLGENWISGNSSLPSPAVIEKSKKLLDDLNSYLVRKKQPIPKLVMGPIPSGGIGLEFHENSENVLYVSFFNNSKIEIELKYFDFYSTIEPTDTDRGVITNYELLAGTDRNSGWGNPLSVLQSENTARRSNRDPC